MPDEQQTTPAVVQGNEPAARTETGEIKNQQTTSTTTTDASTQTKSEPTSDIKADDKTLLNKDDKKPDDKKGDEKPVVPEKYEFKAPEGYEIDSKFVEQATPVLKELGLTNDQAQKLVNLQIEREKALVESPYKLYEETRGGWRKDVFNDPKLGDGTQLKPEVRATISRAIDALPADVAKGFRETMDMTGAGDNPHFVRAMYAWAQMLGEGTGVRGKGPSAFGQTSPDAKPKTAASALYPNLPSSTG